MNLELKLMLTFTRRLSKLRGAGWIANKLKSFYNRKPLQANVCLFWVLRWSLSQAIFLIAIKKEDL